MELIREFKNISKNDVSLAGGKGASLGEMMNAGIPVPDGFVVLATTFEKFLDEAELNAEIISIFDSVNIQEMHTVENASEKIQALIMLAEIPNDISSEIKNYFTKLDSKYVAVRSSATAEDSSSAAWAGQLESYLNTTTETLVENVKKCWASLFTPRAIFYRFEKDLQNQKISVAVVVQKMVESEKSGIAFSVHPVTQNRDQLIIEAAFGLGEAIVSGQITPDSYIVEKQSRQIIDKNIESQEKGLYRVEGGGNEWRDIPDDLVEKQVLSENEILKLSEIVINIENHYGFPCDIEWAMEKSNFYIVQSRPITTLMNIELSKKVLDKDDYILSFWVQGVSVFVTDIHLEAYKKLQPLFIIDNGMFKQYFTKNAYEQALEKGLEFYSDEYAFDNYQKDLSNHCDMFKAFFESEISWQQTISINQLSKFFDFTKKLCGDYTQMNFESTDKAFSSQDGSEIIQKNLSKVAKFKDTIREFMNTVLFDPDGYSNQLFTILGQQFGLNSLLLENLTQKEILGLFEGYKINEDNARNRQNSFVEGYSLESFYEGSDAEEIIQEFREDSSYTDIFQGQVASKGKVTGTVKVIPVDYSNQNRVNEQISKMQQGEILVAETTAPELIVACKKAGAIVTDMGGLMSHAAIVSREFGIPCVVGTKNASKILKDGDFVEVDGDLGTVKVIKQNA